MFLKNIKLKNWKQFDGEHSFSLDKINFIQGSNGIGKSNMSLNAILFSLYGYTGKVKQSDLPTKGKKTCKVELQIDYKANNYTIIREIPSKLSIIQNHTEIEWKEDGIKEKDLYIQEIFGDLNYFKKFRLIDGYDKDINFLEQGNVSLKKILFSVNEGLLNDIRTELLNRKQEIEMYNNKKIKNVIPHYVSQKRKELLHKRLEQINEFVEQNEKEVKIYRKELQDLSQKKGVILATINECKKQLRKAEQTICYACKQPIPLEKRNKIKEKAAKEIKKVSKLYKEIENEVVELKEIIEEYEKAKQELIKKKIKILQYIKILEEKENTNQIFKYTEEDLLIIKEVIEIFDNFSSYYLVESIKTLEPIINSVLEKIKFKVIFEADKKKFNLILIDNKNKQWKYHHLSTGQKLILQIAIKTALLLQRNEVGLIIADEGLGSLDEENLHYIIDLFYNLPFQLVMVLHHFKNLPNYVNSIDLDQYFGV